MNENRGEVALITKKVFSFLPKFFVEVQGKEILTITKELSFFKARYTIDAEGIEVQGNWWDMDFEVYKQGQLVGQVNKEWFTWGDTYKVQIFDEAMETIVIAVVVAIDCVKSDEAAASSAATQIYIKWIKLDPPLYHHTVALWQKIKRDNQKGRFFLIIFDFI